MIAAITIDDLTIAGPLSLPTPLIAALVVCLAVTVAAILATVILSKPSRKLAQPVAHGAHNGYTGKTVWRNRIDAVIRDYRNTVIDREEAFTRLASIARDYASQASGRDLSTQTLADLHRERDTQGNQQGWNLLRQTIEALYPAEFANPEFNASARRVEVEQAAEWVSTLVERWR